MVERARIRCADCRSNVPAVVLWAVADNCPGCQRPLSMFGPHEAPQAVRRRTLTLSDAQSRTDSGRSAVQSR